MVIKWFPSTNTDVFPRNILFGGFESDGSRIYVGRSYHEEKFLPVNVVPSKKSAFASWCGMEIPKTNYELLVDDNVTWQSCDFTKSNGIPENAVSTGQISCGEPIFIGRGHYEDSLIVGRIQVSHGCLYIPFNGTEIKLLYCDILIRCGNKQKKLKEFKDSKWGPVKELPEPVFQVKEVRAACFQEPNYLRNTEPQTQAQSQPEQSQQDNIPSTPNFVNPIPPSEASQPHNDVWVLAQPGCLPQDAVHAGYDIDGKLMYVSRVYHNGDYIPAKAFPDYNSACVPYQGREIVVSKFEYLVGKKYMWISPNPFPLGAVVVNPLSTNEALYVGRSNYGGSLLCGKFQRSLNCLFVPFGTREIAITSSFEILVQQDRYMSSNQPPSSGQ